MSLSILAFAGSVIIPIAQAQSVATFWTDYPTCERQCHQTVYGNQSCTLQNNCACSGCLCLTDSCLCETASWLTAVTQCIGQQCGASAVSEAAGIANSACAGNGHPLIVSEQTLIAEGLAAIPSASSAASSIASSPTAQSSSPTTQLSSFASATSNPTAQQSSSSTTVANPQITSTSTNIATGSHNGPSTALIAVIAVLGALVVAAIIGGLLYYRHRRSKNKKDLAASQNLLTEGGRPHAGDAPDQKTFPFAPGSDQTRMDAIPGWNNATGQGGIELEARPHPVQSVSNFSGSTVTPMTYHELESRY